MARSKSIEAFRRDPPELEPRIVEAIKEFGPHNVSRLAKSLDAHQETVRYKLKMQFKTLGFHIHADVDYQRLGLRLHWATIRFSKANLRWATRILGVLNEVGYLTYYAKIIPQGHYVALFAIPAGTTGDYREFLAHLQDLGIIENFQFEEALVSRHNSMNPRYFNFRSGSWEVDWTKVRLDEARPLKLPHRAGTGKVDMCDLLIVKEFQKDAMQHLAEIARKVKISPKTLEYHYRSHVQGRLIPGYNVRWMRDLERTLAHSVLLTRLTASGLGRQEFASLQGAVSKIPFLWAEDLLKDGTYIATVLMPVQDAVATFAYLNNEVPNLDAKVSIGFIKIPDAYLYTIPYNMFDEKRKKWSFALRDLISDFDRAGRRAKKQEASTL